MPHSYFYMSQSNNDCIIKPKKMSKDKGSKNNKKAAAEKPSGKVSAYKSESKKPSFEVVITKPDSKSGGKAKN